MDPNPNPQDPDVTQEKDIDPDLSCSDEETLLASDVEDANVETPNPIEGNLSPNSDENNSERVPLVDKTNVSFEFTRPRTPRRTRASSVPPKSAPELPNKDSPVFYSLPKSRTKPLVNMSDSDESRPSSIERATRKRASRSLLRTLSSSSSSVSSDTDEETRKQASGSSTERTGTVSDQERKKKAQAEEAERARLSRIKKANERNRKEKERRERMEKERKEREEKEKKLRDYKAKKEREEIRKRRKQREEADRARILKDQAEIKRLDKIRRQMEEDIRRLQRQEESIPRAHVSGGSGPASISDLPDPPPTIPGMYVDPETLTALISSIHKIADNQKASLVNPAPSVVPSEENVLTAQEKRLIALDRAYEVPNKNFEYAEHEKLHGSRNYKEWKKRFSAELAALNLTPFIKSVRAEGVVEISDGKRVMLDQQALTFVRSTVDKNIRHVIADAETCYDAMVTIDQLYQHNRIHDRVLLESRFNALKFKDGFNRERFTGEFENLVAQIEKNGETFSQEIKAVKFLEKIEGINNRSSPFYGFYGDITSKRPEKITYEYVKERFYAVRLTKEDTNKGTKRKFDDKSDENDKKKRKGDDKQSSSDSNKNKNQSKNKENQKAADKGQSNQNYETKKGEQWKARTLREKYTKEQLDRLKTMSKEEKRANQCSKCWEYFHDVSTCKNPGPMCFICKRYDHIAEKCKYYDEAKHSQYKKGKSKEN